MGASLEWSARTRRQEDRFPIRGAACVVEPDDDARAAIADALRNMGYTTHETGSGAVGAFIAEQVHLQVALVNVVLPDAKGLQLIRRFRANCPDAAIVALTPNVSLGIGAVLAHFAGADTSVSAPASQETLSAAVTEASGLSHEDAYA
jgi:two-component system, OmpR family, response regulator